MATEPLSPAPAPAESISIRSARPGDLPAIVALLSDDPLGASREDATLPLDEGYTKAFEEIKNDPNQLLLVVELEAVVVGTLQLTFIPGLSHKGALRGQIEAVRIASNHRDQGIGARLVTHAIALCKQRSCRMVELTTSNARTDAHRFYSRLGFNQSHKGFKLRLDTAQS
ncbi:MAG: GNAT family N-acetyltransferase [Beijerinckiaceae bacterium]